MIEQCRGLTAQQLEAVAGLERRALTADGGRLKLEWGALRTRSGDRVDDVLAWEGSQLVGFAGLYQWGGGEVEVAGMVDPAHRRRGIAAALLDRVLVQAGARGAGHVLLVTSRPSIGGRALAAGRAATLDHSEHALVLDGDPVDGPSDPRVALRRARPGDEDAVVAQLAAAFDWTPPDIERMLADPDERTLLIELDGAAVGTVRLTLDGGVGGVNGVDGVGGADGVGGVYGFAVHPDRQGRGIGRDVLRRCCRQLRADGAGRVGLEVVVDNDRALGLYTSTGFTPVSTEDYWRVEVGG